MPYRPPDYIIYQEENNHTVNPTVLILIGMLIFFYILFRLG